MLAQSSYGGPENLPEIVWYSTADEEDDPWYAVRDAWLIDKYRAVLGVELLLQPVSREDAAAMLGADPENYPQLGSYTMSLQLADPYFWLAYWTCDAAVFAVRIGYCNPAFDSLLAQVGRELDPERRTALAEEAGRLLVADAPAIFVYTASGAWLVKPYVTGYSRERVNVRWPGFWTPLTVDVAPH